MEKITLEQLKKNDEEIKRTISPAIEQTFCRVCGNVMVKQNEIIQGFHTKCEKRIEKVI